MSSSKAPATVLDLSAALADLATDLVGRVPELAHIDPQRLLFCLARSRADGTHGIYARIAPLRFAAGKVEEVRRRGHYRETYRLPAFNHRGRDILYLIYLLVPRFLRLSEQDKLQTVIHELYHVSEACDGDIRRFAGRNFAHGSSRRQYNRSVATLVENYLATNPNPALLQCLQTTEEDWQQGRLRLTGLRVPLPRAKLVARDRV